MSTGTATAGARAYGWRPQRPDHRDYGLPDHIDLTAPLPSRFSLRNQMPPIYDQGHLGSCTANALAGALEHQQYVQGEGDITPSRLFIYFNERQMEGTVSLDAGAVIRDGIKAINRWGAPSESLWPYSDANPGAFQRRPSHAAYVAGEQHRALAYHAVPQNLAGIRSCIHAGHPVVFGFTVYESFETQQVAASGLMPMPAPNEASVGGHAVIATGWDDQRKLIEVRNSWSVMWGDQGYFWMPYQYITSRGLASDFWIVLKTT